MAGKADFTDAEWQTLEKGITGSAMLVSLADASFFDSFKEVGALASNLGDARAFTLVDNVSDYGRDRRDELFAYIHGRIGVTRRRQRR